jgi:hypothetical protein
MTEAKVDNTTMAVEGSEHSVEHAPLPGIKQGSKLYRIYTHPWFQVSLIGFICFCLPGIYNALSGIGGSGQVDSTVAANASVALLAATAVTALFIVGPIFKIIGPMWSLIVGGWTYALYSGSLLHYNRKQSLDPRRNSDANPPQTRQTRPSSSSPVVFSVWAPPSCGLPRAPS